MRLPLIIIALIITTGTAPSARASTPKFTVTQSDDRFSTDGTTTYISTGNRISKRSISGGVHIDKCGVYIDPSVILNPTDRDLKIVVLHLMNRTDRFGVAGAPNSLGQLQRVSFITGEGPPIILEFTEGRQKFGDPDCTFAGVGCVTPITETAGARISVRDYKRLIAATALAIKVEGSERSRVYETGDIAPSFLANLTSFYTAYIADKP